MSAHQLRTLCVITLYLMVSPAQQVFGKGSRNIGLGLGLSSQTVVFIEVQSPEETLLFCSSDDGVQAVDILGSPQDLSPGEPTEREPRRSFAHIILYPPTARPCIGSEACEFGQLCMDPSSELPLDAPSASSGECAFAFTVAPTAEPSLGFCDHLTSEPNYHRFQLGEVGNWRLDMVGEPPTLGGSNESTRFFDLELLNGNGELIEEPRIFSYQWFLTTHTARQAASTRLYPRRLLFDRPLWSMLSLSGIQEYGFGVLLNRAGILESAGRTSVCERIVEGRTTPPCPLDFEGRRAELFAQLPIFITAPSSVSALPEFLVDSVSIQDEAGTDSISPNADGIQDEFEISFNASHPGMVRLWIDINRDGLPQPEIETVLSAPFDAGAQSLSWDGSDASGARIPSGTYPIRLHFSFGEQHVILIGSEVLQGGLEVRTLGDEALTLFWDDGPIYQLALPKHTSTPWSPNPSARTWQEEAWPAVARPALFDTWTSHGALFVDEAQCRRCSGPISNIRITTDDEAPDRDRDGLSDEEEDVNGNGRIDPGETDPDNPDTDGDGLDDLIETNGEPSPVREDTDQDGLNDGIEDESGDGFYQNGETDPTNPDTDGDGLFDGTEDTNRNGRVDEGETDPRIADTDGDGIGDADDPFPLDPERGERLADGFTPLATADMGTDAFGLNGAGTDDIENEAQYGEEGFLGCDCSIAKRSPLPVCLFGLLGLIITNRRKRP